MRKIRFFVFLLSVLALFIVPTVASAASPAPTAMTHPVLMLTAGNTTATVVTIQNGAPVQQQLALASAPVFANGNVYLSTATLEQVSSIYGGSSVVSNDGMAILLNSGGYGLLAVAGQDWYIQFCDGYAYPIVLDTQYYASPIVIGGVAYWSVSILDWMPAADGQQVQTAQNGKGGAVIYANPNQKG